MDRVVIIGVQGSGKSTFANKLGKVLGRDVTHLDKLYYKPGWQAVTKVEWQEILQGLVARKQWILDGNYNSNLGLRLDAADTVIFLNFPKWICIYRACKRAFQKAQPFDKVEGNKEKVSWTLIWKIITYPKKEMVKRLEKDNNGKKIYILKNDRDADLLLASLT